MTPDTLQKICKYLFGRSFNVETYAMPHVEETVVKVTYVLDQRRLERAASGGDRSMLDDLLEQLGGRPQDWGKRAKQLVAEKERRFSFKAGRRTGRHKK